MSDPQGMAAIVSALDSAVSQTTIFTVFAQLVPWISTLIIALLGLYFLRKLIKGAARGKLKI